MNETKSQRKTVEVTLLKAHTHDGKSYPAGAKIQVTEPERAWLAEHEVIAAAARQEGGK